MGFEVWFVKRAWPSTRVYTVRSKLQARHLANYKRICRWYGIYLKIYLKIFQPVAHNNCPLNLCTLSRWLYFSSILYIFGIRRVWTFDIRCRYPVVVFWWCFGGIIHYHSTVIPSTFCIKYKVFFSPFWSLGSINKYNNMKLVKRPIFQKFRFTNSNCTYTVQAFGPIKHEYFI